MSADFKPNKNTLKHVDTFNHWCQKVLPLVYDESLSYYELLCKVTDILNRVIENGRKLGNDVSGLHKAYVHLQDYVNNYYANLDVQNEINNKLDAMSRDGSLSLLLSPLFNELRSEIAVLEARMNAFSTLKEGSTTGDAELNDARVNKDGYNRANVGQHIRGVATEVSKKANVSDLLYSKKYLSSDDFECGYIAISSGEITDKIRGVYNKGFLKSGAYLDVTDKNLVGVAIYSYKEDGTFNSGGESFDTPYLIETIENNKFKVLFYWKETGLYGDITAEKAIQLKDYVTVRTTEDSPYFGNNENIEEIKDMLSKVNTGVGEYYFESDYLPNKVKAINDNMCEVGVNGESFVFITDVHWDLGNAKQSPMLINYIKEHTNIDCVVCGGDIINEGNKDDMKTVFLNFVNEMKKIGIPVPTAYGNHDDNSNGSTPQSEYFDENTVMNLEFKHVLEHITFINPTYDRSFYFDKVGTKTRFIFLDTRNNGTIKWESITPIFNALESVPDGYKVVVVGHWLVANGELTGWGKRIADTLDAYNKRGGYTNDQNGVTYNFSKCKGKCVLIVCGHTHVDNELITTGGIPVLNTTCDNYNRSVSGLERVKGSVTEQAFDVITVNYVDGSVKAVRVGSGSDRRFVNGVWI